MKSNLYIVELIRKKMDDSISEEELRDLQNWCAISPFYSELLRKIENEPEVLEDLKIWLDLRTEDKEWLEKLQQTVQTKIYNQPKRFLRIYANIAAVILLVFSFSFLIYKYSDWEQSPISIEDLSPGGTRARITLSDGRVLNLREDRKGIVFGQKLNYEDGTFIDSIDMEQIEYATLETPKGGQYHVTLSDGSEVWLNAYSKLTYPVIFRGDKRVVHLEGEAYFTISKFSHNGKQIPFVVETTNQKINVLGTQFNVYAYKDKEEYSERTTLVEGKVIVENGNMKVNLNPGFQCIVRGGILHRQEVDVATDIAWKENKFVFEDTDLRDALRILGRWYNFEFKVENPSYNVQLYAHISRSKSFKDVLAILKESGIKYKLEREKETNRLVITN